jgi:hypothetical protein
MERPNYVKQGTYKIINKSMGSLVTSGLATCSAISFIINQIDVFMAHIDAKTDVTIIANDIKSKYKEPIHYEYVKIWYGDGIYQTSSEFTQKLIAQFTNILGIPIKPIIENDDDINHDYQENIIQCKLCKSKSGTLKIIPHYYSCKYSCKTIIQTVGFMTEVNTF